MAKGNNQQNRNNKRRRNERLQERDERNETGEGQNKKKRSRKEEVYNLTSAGLRALCKDLGNGYVECLRCQSEIKSAPVGSSFRRHLETAKCAAAGVLHHAEKEGDNPLNASQQGMESRPGKYNNMYNVFPLVVLSFSRFIGRRGGASICLVVPRNSSADWWVQSEPPVVLEIKPLSVIPFRS